MKIRDKLFVLRDEKYAAFSAKLTPGIDINKVIGVRLPLLRKLAKEYSRDEEADEFLKTLPHDYFDENMLHGVLLSLEKNYDECIRKLDEFLPYVDNWAVCDIISPVCFKKNKIILISKLDMWLKSDHPFTIRFAMEMYMSFYIDEDYKKEYSDSIAEIRNDEYYVRMMQAWYFATALAKQWDDSIKFLEEKKLDKWTHNKTIQKAIESYRITAEQKDYLRSLKIK